MRKILFFIFLLGPFSNNGLKAQVAGQNLAFLPEYQEQLPYFQELITGGQYQEPSRLIQGDPYYFSRQFEKGTLIINGVTYPQVPLLYDSYRDQVVTFHPVFNQKILIKPEKIDGFQLANGERFRHFSGNGDYLKNGNGIYKVLGEGDYLAVAKQFKTTKAVREMSKYDEIYLAKSDYFLVKDGVFLQIQKGNQAFEILGLEKKFIKKELRARNLVFKQNPEEYLKFLVQVNSK
ncbi:hypothetical protein DFQ04_3352 [Algoriphagus boseongensis]|uniref:WG repeat protein n=1 Tax=Algoriphagus boseongensis TaxID=1442587 RepID=A0A4R6T3I6_9BACT|nr:hypothetical protein [Algoriphagus boseongensis]TDQ14758.1 hypothetical protein DFQ04_3352 [Algoriphagus boseongensis]